MIYLVEHVSLPGSQQVKLPKPHRHLGCVTQPLTDTEFRLGIAGDWEHVTVRLANDTMLPVSMLLAQHAGGKTYPWGSPEVQLDTTDGGQHPIVYSANGAAPLPEVF
jgi:hypothetical protein